MESDNPYQAPQTSPVETAPLPTKRFRFRVIPATLMFLYGFSGAVGGLMMLGFRVWLAVTDRTEILRDERTLYTWMMVAILGLSIGGFIAGIYWMRGRWKAAIIATIATITLHAIVGALGST